MSLFNITLRYQDTNGHNFRVLSDIPDRKLVKRVIICLPGANNQVESDIDIDAIETYKTDIYGITIRSKQITAWLKANSTPGTLFSGTLEVSDNGEQHKYRDIKLL